MLADELYSMIHVLRLEDENAAELFFDFGIGVVATLPFYSFCKQACIEYLGLYGRILVYRVAVLISFSCTRACVAQICNLYQKNAA